MPIKIQNISLGIKIPCVLYDSVLPKSNHSDFFLRRLVFPRLECYVNGIICTLWCPALSSLRNNSDSLMCSSTSFSLFLNSLSWGKYTTVRSFPFQRTLMFVSYCEIRCCEYYMIFMNKFLFPYTDI